MAEEKSAEEEDKKLPEGEDEEESSKKNTSKTDKRGDVDDNKEGEDEDTDLGEGEIDVRRSALQHIVARQTKTIKKLRSKQEEEIEGEEGDYEGETEEDKEVDIAGEVKKQIEPVLKVLTGKIDEDEVSALFQIEPEAKKYEKRIRAYMKNPHYQGVPPSVIFHHLAFDKAAQIKSKKKEVADLEADQMRSSGRPARRTMKQSDIPDADEVLSMPDKEFEELQNKVMTGQVK